MNTVDTDSRTTGSLPAFNARTLGLMFVAGFFCNRRVRSVGSDHQPGLGLFAVVTARASEELTRQPWSAER